MKAFQLFCPEAPKSNGSDIFLKHLFGKDLTPVEGWFKKSEIPGITRVKDNWRTRQLVNLIPDSVFCCAAGHLKIWKLIAETCPDGAFVFEDDALPTMPGWRVGLELDRARKVGGLVYLTVPEPERHKRAKEPVRWTRIMRVPYWGAYAYFLDQRMAQHLVKARADTIDVNADTFLPAEALTSNRPIYRPSAPIFVPSLDDSLLKRDRETAVRNPNWVGLPRPQAPSST